MGVELVKVINGKAALQDGLENHKLIMCRDCGQRYQFRYSNGEAYRLNEWLPKAQAVVDESHVGGHSADSMPVAW